MPSACSSCTASRAPTARDRWRSPARPSADPWSGPASGTSTPREPGSRTAPAPPLRRPVCVHRNHPQPHHPGARAPLHRPLRPRAHLVHRGPGHRHHPRPAGQPHAGDAHRARGAGRARRGGLPRDTALLPAGEAAVNTGEFLAALDALAPARLAEEWDNVGLMVGRRDRPVTRVIVALDLRAAVLDEAVAEGADLVLVHHPPIFPAMSAVTDARTAGALVLRAAEEQVAVVAAHTNLDSAAGGLNDQMAAALGITGTTPLMSGPDDPSVGLGRVGEVTLSTLGALAAAAVAAYRPGGVNTGMAGDPDLPVTRVAVCTGSGGSLVEAAREAGVHAYVTGDLKYHDADAAEGMGLVNIPHGVVEQHALAAWTPRLAEALAPAGVQVRVTSVDTDPWREAC
ncbi:MAG: Nif3-like dinuclear metal center hexameric protein [Actinobacteria bacterium]|nr:Nif3-like dinuclear metal center hexameric protein [Actinomycetota bacterium]